MKQLNFGSTNGVPNDPNKTVVHCPTQELAQKVLRIADSEWYNEPRKLYEEDRWNKYKTETCYNLAVGSFSHKDFYREAGATILPAEEFIRLNTVEQPDAVEINPFQVGDKVFHHSVGWGNIDAIYPKGIEINGVCVRTDAVSFTEYTLQGFSQERPKELDFDASCLPAWANKFIAMDDGGQWYGFLYIPKIDGSVWYGNEYCEIPDDFAPKNFSGSWQDSLHQIKDGKAVKVNQ